MSKRKGYFARQAAIAPYLFIAPAIVMFAFLFIYPVLHGFSLSLQTWSIIAPTTNFVGFDNYIRAYNDPLFWRSLWNTVYYILLTIPTGIIVALALAIAINSRLVGLKSLYRTVYFIPVVTSMIATSYIWKWMYSPRMGLINYLLRSIGLDGQPWLNSPDQALIAIAIMMVWKSLGFNMVLFLAGLQAIPDTYYEAAMIDGASRWQIFRKITLPLLNPTTIFILITSVIASFQVFAPVFVMSTGFGRGQPGGPLNSTRVLVLHLYQAAFRDLEMGYGSALAFILFAMILVITILQFRFFQRDQFHL